MKLAKVSMAAFKALPAERRKFWRDAAREAAATEGGESEADGDDDADDEYGNGRRKGLAPSYARGAPMWRASALRRTKSPAGAPCGRP